ncbi:MAG TPA: sporulation protein YabP [Syntrophomonadaceae bacterium]|nr:sporulation protein YabP [Syntrophomonadaceae bacterium]
MAEHNINISNRSNMELTGVNQVNTFDEEVIVLETSLGYLYIIGQNLHITMLNLEEGKVALEGSINSIEYKPQGVDLKTKSKKILSRLLK